MKTEMIEAQIVNDEGVVATVSLVDDVCVKVDIKQVVGWKDWLDLSDAVRRVMLMMDVKND